ncbi:serine peptidase, family S28 [Aspergillus campestris IBT 28561]|uniref:Serine peptidase, family S28 n=1 Tax=Aspergillus campestris (strain IBT 28561) TaxID=1392248 RepID=A0A2I1D3P5_ASPC2|nr:serine peptidase, family S28 [Aspergillus campestris IBT 28561]PKY04489.1 serine peptidase, family S28 [Aspergillus campestris IBT 28561]
MYRSLLNSIGILCLAALWRPVAAMGSGNTAYMRRVLLAAQAGLDPSLVLDDKMDFHSLISHPPHQEPPPETEFVTIPIDHNDSSVGTYQNRYWVSEKFFQPGSPVIMYDAGELNAQNLAALHLASDTSFFTRLLKEFNAMGIVWEHRYYGESAPFPISLDTPPEHFKYLTTRQAIEDIPYFAQNFTRVNYTDVDLTPKGTPWVMVGGSYAGTRAAFMRNEHPETIFAALSSSAPIQAQVDMTSYFDQVYRAMVANGYSNCTRDIHAAYQYIDGQLAEDTGSAAAIKRLFFGEEGAQNSNEDFTGALTHLYDYFQGYGLGGVNGNIAQLCDHIEHDPSTNQTAGPDGVAAMYGGRYAAERMAAWPLLVRVTNSNLGLNCGPENDTLPVNCELGKPSTDADTISWSWQYCTEWGFYQSNNAGEHALLSRFQTLQYQQEICNRQFPDAVAAGVLPATPEADRVNSEFGGWTVRPSNTMFSVGEFDPWRTLSVLSAEEFAPQDVVWSSDVPRCGEVRDTVFGYVVPNSEHCFDFQLISDEGKASMEVFKSALKQWLPCFVKGVGGEA